MLAILENWGDVNYLIDKMNLDGSPRLISNWYSVKPNLDLAIKLLCAQQDWRDVANRICARRIDHVEWLKQDEKEEFDYCDDIRVPDLGPKIFLFGKYFYKFKNHMASPRGFEPLLPP